MSGRARRLAVGAGVVALVAVGACSTSSDDGDKARPAEGSLSMASPSAVEAYRETVPTRFVTDDFGRVVIMRGTNVDSASKDSGHLTPLPDAELDRVSNEFGWNTVRVLLNWSAIEPEKGRFDDGLLAHGTSAAGDAGRLFACQGDDERL